MSSARHVNQKKQRRYFLITAALLVAVILSVLAFAALRGNPLAVDPAAANAPRASPADEAAMLAALQAQAEEESFRLRLNGAPTFSADGEGDLLLQNPLENTRSMQVTITLDETGEEVYQSAVLPPGGQELRAALSPIPQPGTHRATAQVSVIDPGTGEAVGSLIAELSLTIEE